MDICILAKLTMSKEGRESIEVMLKIKGIVFIIHYGVRR